jgi:hypothetical protein
VELVWGITIAVLGLLAWGGQALTWFAPGTAARLSLVEREDTVEDVYWADIRGEALWDLTVLWMLPAAGILLIAGHATWAYLGLIGGSMYVYFAGRGILTRLELQRRGFRIGEPGSVRLGLAMLSVWAAAGLITIGAAVADLA